MAAAEIPPAAVRLYARCYEISCEVDDAIADSEPVEELLARCDRTLRASTKFKLTGEFDFAAIEADEAERAKAKAAVLATHPEYQWTRAELARLLALGPDDVHPLDVGEDCTDGRALELRFRLDRAHLDFICWWRSPPMLRVV
jgi:hypothetical protein